MCCYSPRHSWVGAVEPFTDIYLNYITNGTTHRVLRTNLLTDVTVTLRSRWLGDTSSRPCTWMTAPLSVVIFRMVWPPLPMIDPTTELSTRSSTPPLCFEARVSPGAWSWEMDVN